MKLSGYIRALQKIQRQQKRKGIDPTVVCERYSDITADIGDVAKPMNTHPDCTSFTPVYPRVIRGVRHGRDKEWIRRLDATDPPVHDEQVYVVLCEGN